MRARRGLEHAGKRGCGDDAQLRADPESTDTGRGIDMRRAGSSYRVPESGREGAQIAEASGTFGLVCHIPREDTGPVDA
jgi:hypothetical protein